MFAKSRCSACSEHFASETSGMLKTNRSSVQKRDTDPKPGPKRSMGDDEKTLPAIELLNMSHDHAKSQSGGRPKKTHSSE